MHYQVFLQKHVKINVRQMIINFSPNFNFQEGRWNHEIHKI